MRLLERIFSAITVPKDGEWHPFTHGKRSGLEMRRWIGGQWETRPATQEEVRHHLDAEAW